MSEVVLTARGVSFAYGERRVLEDVEVCVRSGTVVGLVGPNGAGKTTLLKILAGLLEGGEVSYGARPLGQMPRRAQAAFRAYIAQDSGEPFPYTVGEVVAMGQAHDNVLFAPPPPGPAVDAALTEVGFGGQAARRFDALSGGERQLVLLARAIVQARALLLLDEPASQLDLGHRAAMVRALSRRARAGAAVVWSMHDLSLAALACDQLLLLAGGKVVAVGTPDEVLVPERLRQVYGVALVLGRHPLKGTPTVELDPRGFA